MVDWISIKSNGPRIIQVDTTNFGSPIAIDDLNTLGWEDSASINWAGTILTYNYSKLDPFYYLFYGAVRLDGPDLIDWPNSVTYPGSQYGSEIYIAKKSNETWEIRNAASPVNTPLGSERSPQMTEGNDLMYFLRSSGNQSGIYSCQCENGFLNNPVLLPQPNINYSDLTVNYVDNPFLCENGTFLFERGTANLKNIYLCMKTGDNTYSTPYAHPIINSPGDDISSPWMSPDGLEMLYVKNHFYIFRYFTYLPQSVSNPYPICYIDYGHPNAAAVGHPTMDKNGNLYFTFVFKALDEQGRNQFDSDIFMFPKKV